MYFPVNFAKEGYHYVSADHMVEIFKNSFCYRKPVTAFDMTLFYTLND